MADTGKTGSFNLSDLKKINITPKKAPSASKKPTTSSTPSSKPSIRPTSKPTSTSTSKSTASKKPKPLFSPFANLSPSSVRALEASAAADVPSAPAASKKLTSKQSKTSSLLTGSRTTKPSDADTAGDRRLLSLAKGAEAANKDDAASDGQSAGDRRLAAFSAEADPAITAFAGERHLESLNRSAETAASDDGGSTKFLDGLVDLVKEAADERNDPLSVHAEPPSDGEGVTRGDSRGNSITVYEDGTRVSRSIQDGEIRSTTTITEDDGTVRRTTSYTEDGVEHSTTTITSPSGTVRTIDDRIVDDELQRTDSRTYEADGELLEEIPRQGLVQVDTDGAGPIERTTERVGNYDLSSDPPEYRPISETETTSVELPNVVESGDRLDLQGTNLVQTDPIDLGRDVTIDQDESGRTASLQIQTIYDENGEPLEPVETFRFETRVRGVDADGNEVSITEEEGQVIQEDIGITEFRIADIQGVYKPEDVIGNNELGDIEDYPEFADRIVENNGEYVDVRTTQFDGQSYQVEVGNYADPGSDGETVTLLRTRDAGESLSLRKVSNDGRNVDEQTVYPGTELTSITRAQFEDDGSYVSRTETINSGETIQEIVREGQVVERSDVSRDINSQARSRFLSNAEGEIVEESITTTNFDEDGNSTVETGLNYRASESDANLQYLDGPDGKLSVVQHGNEIYAVDQSGNIIETNNAGQFTVNGDILRDEDGGAFSVPSPLSKPRSGISALNRLFKASEERGFRNNPFPKSFQNKVSALGAGFAAVNIGAELLDGDVVGAIEDTGSGAVSLVGGAKLLGASEVALRRLNVAGAVLNTGLAVRDLANGDYLDAGLKAGTAAGLGLVAIGGALTGPLGLAILGGIGLFEIGRFIFSNRDQAELPELVI